MPLIDLTTNLRDLKFGKDRAAEGSSDQPYVQTIIPDYKTPQNEKNLINSLGIDFIVRGGILAPLHAVEDMLRLTTWFGIPLGQEDISNIIGALNFKGKVSLAKKFSKPENLWKGIAFTLKQNLLSRLSVKTQSSGAFLNDGLYTPISTITSAGGSAFGLRVNKQLTIDNLINLFQKKGLTLGRYEGEAYERNSNDNEWEKSSRLFQLQNSIITETPITFGRIKLRPDPSILLKYEGGPGAPLGIGFTNIKFASERTSGENSKAKPHPNHTTLKPSEVPPDNINTLNYKQQSIPSIMDFRRLITVDYSTKNIENRLNLGSPGKNKNVQFPRHDKINALPLYQSENVKSNDLSFPTTDIIPFRIGVINNDNPTLKTYIHFRAFLDNINDSYSADWKKQNYIGRGEDFFTYSGFDRKVSLSWTVVAQSKEELIPMYKKLNYLASVIMPDYSTAGYMRGNMVTLTVGGYFNEQPGIITGFSFDMNDDSATWDIGIDENGSEDPTTSQLPHLIKVKGFNFIPIHTFVPRLQQNEFGTAIINSNTSFTPGAKLGVENDVKYGKEHFIALTPTNETGSLNLYIIDKK